MLSLLMKIKEVVYFRKKNIMVKMVEETPVKRSSLSSPAAKQSKNMGNVTWHTAAVYC